MMIAALFAAAAVSATCDLEKPSGAPDCTRAAVDALKMNALQTVGTHNSYKLAIAPKEMANLRRINPKAADTLDYSHEHLTQQLDDGARQSIPFDPLLVTADGIGDIERCYDVDVRHDVAHASEG